VSGEAADILRGPTNKRSQKQYEKYQNMFKNWLANNSSNDITIATEANLIDFFTYVKHVYAPSTIWSIYSAINAEWHVRRSSKLKDMPFLYDFLKRITKDHKAKKSDIFTSNDINNLMNALDDNESEVVKDKKLVKIVIVLMYYGALQKDDLLKLKLKHIVYKENGDIEI
jgi:integrase